MSNNKIIDFPFLQECIFFYKNFTLPSVSFSAFTGLLCAPRTSARKRFTIPRWKISDENETSVRGRAFFCKMTRGPTRLKNILIATLCLLLQIVISYQQLLGGPYSFVKPLPSVPNLFSRRTGPSSLGSKSKRIFFLS